MDKDELMPCGSNISCFHCTRYYFGCTHIQKLNNDEKEELTIKINKLK